MQIRITNREVEIIRLISKGLSSKAIAQDLNLSINTVKTHRSNILLKMDAVNCADLIRKSFESGLLTITQRIQSSLTIRSLAS